MTNGMTHHPTDYHALGDSASVAEPTVLITSPDSARHQEADRSSEARRPSTAGLDERLVG
jgi:hypothetical protein